MKQRSSRIFREYSTPTYILQARPIMNMLFPTRAASRAVQTYQVFFTFILICCTTNLITLANRQTCRYIITAATLFVFRRT